MSSFSEVVSGCGLSPQELHPLFVQALRVAEIPNFKPHNTAALINGLPSAEGASFATWCAYVDQRMQSNGIHPEWYEAKLRQLIVAHKRSGESIEATVERVVRAELALFRVQILTDLGLAHKLDI